jgi:hypothetical protein
VQRPNDDWVKRFPKGEGMKIIITIAAATLLAGCAIGSTTQAPTELARGAAVGMWTSRPAEEVRACVDRVLAQTPSPYRYEVTANDTDKTHMATTVSGFTDGNSDPAGARIVATCLSPA